MVAKHPSVADGDLLASGIDAGELDDWWFLERDGFAGVPVVAGVHVVEVKADFDADVRRVVNPHNRPRVELARMLRLTSTWRFAITCEELGVVWSEV